MIRRVQNERNFRGKRVSATTLSRSHFFQFPFFFSPHPPLLKGEEKIFSRKSATLEKRVLHTAVESHLWDTSIKGTPPFVCPRYNRESEGGRTFSVSATRLWNSLPIDLKKGTCVTSFRKAIYSHFLTRYNDVDHFSLSET